MISVFLLFIFIKKSYETLIIQNHIYYEVENGEATVLGQEEGSGMLTNVVFPEFVSFENNDYVVTKIDDYAFSESQTISGTMTFPNSLKTIGYGSFAFCYGIYGQLIIPDSVTSIGEFCFSETNISSITFSEQLTTIPVAAFQLCTNLTTVPIFPPNLQSIE